MKTSTLAWLPASAAIAVSMLLASCGAGGPVKVVIDNANGDTSTVVIDGKTTIKLPGDTALTIELKPGTHNVVIDKGKPQEFKVGGKGGLLNIDDAEYVAFAVEYAPQQKYGDNSIVIPNARISDMVVVDSFLIWEKSAYRRTTDSSLRRRLPEIMSDPDGTISIAKFEHEGINGLKKTGKGKLFIDKFWDYDMNEEMPRSIEIKTRQTDIMSSSSRSKIIRARQFLILAMVNSSLYEVRSLESIRTGKKTAAGNGNDEAVPAEAAEAAPAALDK